MSACGRGLTAGEIAQRLAAPLEGDPTPLVCKVAPLAEADGESLSWLGDLKYAGLLAGTRAAAVLARPDVPAVGGPALIRVPDPDLALIRVLEWLMPPIERPLTGIDPRAAVDPTARVEGAAIGAFCSVGPRTEIGTGTVLHPGVQVGHDCRIGRDCTLWNGVVVRERCEIGDRVILHPNASIGADGFGYLFRDGRHVHIPQIGIVRIEDDVEIGANSCVDRARSGVTRIGRGTKIDNLVQIGHNCDIGEHCMIIAQCGVSGSSTLGRYVVLAGQVGVADHVMIGDGVQVAAMSGVLGRVPPGEKLRGVPAVGMTDFARHQILLRRLPQLNEQVRELAKRIERLEASDDHRP